MYFYYGKYLVGEWKGSHVHASMHQKDQYTYPFSTKLLCVGIIICPSKAINILTSQLLLPKMGTQKNDFLSKNLWALASNQVLSMSTRWK